MSSFAKNLHTALSEPAVLGLYMRWMAAGLTSGERTISIDAKLIGGFPNFSSYLGTWRNRITKEEREFLATHIKRDAVVFDVGANWGLFSLAMADLVGAGGKVFAFEPVPATYSALSQNLARNGAGTVHCVNSAVGAQRGEVRFTNTRDPATNRIDESGELVIPLENLDAFCEDRGIARIDFLKIDVEGAEIDVVKGASRLLRAGAIANGIIEICPGNLKAFGSDMEDLHDIFAEVGYALYWLESPDDVLSKSDLTSLPANFLGNAGFKAAVQSEPNCAA